jgi:hypothetical protein
VVEFNDFLKQVKMSEIMYRFEYGGGTNYKIYWVIQKRFLWLFWRNYKKMSYKILDDGYPNINEVMNYVEQLNQNNDNI